MKKFRTLELAIEFYENVENLKIRGHLREQLLRASSSISLNLSEGNAKESIAEKKRYYRIAYGSVQECKTILRLAKCEDEKLLDLADKLAAWLFKLTKSEISVKWNS